jgi:hypothetical protein
MTDADTSASRRFGKNDRMHFTRRQALAAGLSLALLSPAAFAQKRDFSSDISILRDAYETLHPGLYRYAAPRRVHARLDTLARAWTHTESRADAYLSLSRFLATVRCGHSYANFYNQSDAVRAELFDAAPRLPFHFIWLDERMIITRSYADDARLTAGTEVLSINGVAASRILRTLLPYVRADGGNDDKRRALLGVRGNAAYETFDVFYGLVFNPTKDFRLRIKPVGARADQTLNVASIDLAARRATMAPDVGDGAAWTVNWPDPKTAHLIMPT